MPLPKDMTRDELVAALNWCMKQLRKQWFGRVYSETWGQQGSPWATDNPSPQPRPWFENFN